MLNSTRDLLLQAHYVFTIFNYKVSPYSFNEQDFIKCGINALNHSEEFEDSIVIIQKLQFCLKNFDKIIAKAIKHIDFWNSLKYKKYKPLNLVEDEYAEISYFVTNIFSKKKKDIFFCGQSFEGNNIYLVNYQRGKWSFFTDSKYFLRFSKLSNSKMVLLDQLGYKLCTISLNEHCNLCLSNNMTPYGVLCYENGMYFYERKYLMNLGNQEPDSDHLCAFITWDLLNDKSRYALSRVEIYEEENSDNFEILMLFAASCFLIFNADMDEQRASSLASFIIWQNCMRNLRH